MANDVVLSAALRSNLLSLQSTQKGIDNAQFKLSTGKKVNSALDNPQSFFASQALTNRASDLTKLLDGIGQSIQVIKAADNGVTALTSLVNSAQAIATSAQDALTSGSGAQLVGTVASTTTAAGILANGNTFDITTIDSNGVKNKQTITVNTTDTVAGVIAKINTAYSATKELTATINSSGFAEIKGANGVSVRIDNARNGGAAYTVAQGTALVTGLGFGASVTNTTNGEANAGGATTGFGVTVNAKGSVISSAALTVGGTLATAGTKVASLNGFNITAATQNLSIQVDNGTAQTFDLFSNNLTIQGLVDNINANVTINTSVKASFDSSTGKLNITATGATVRNVTIGNGTTAASGNTAFGFGSGRTDAVTADNVTENFVIPTSAGSISTTLTGLQTQYNNVLSQIDALVTNGDTSYRGTNLLNGNNLVTTFNESRTSSLTTAGVTFNSTGLGLTTASFSTAATVTTSLTQVQAALDKLRSFGSSLAGDLSTIQTRQDFTSNVINTLTTGSDLLTNADQNEEGAKLLALQTRQSLGVTALSLASQSQQSILRLFG